MLVSLAACAPSARVVESGTCRAQRVAEAPVSLVGNHAAVPMLIDGTAVEMLLDTGSERTVVTEAAARRLGLPPSSAPAPLLRGVGGSARHADVLVRRIQLGSVLLGHDGANSVGVLATSALNGRTFDGVLGTDLLAAHDLELDLEGGRMALWNVSGCSGGFAGWGADTQSIPIVLRHGNLAFLPAYLDGWKLVALLDTGSDRTLLSTRAAEKMGVTADMLAHDPGGVGSGVGAGNLGIRMHRFNRLQVGPELASAPTIVVADLPPLPLDMLLGVDFLRAHRIWLSYTTAQVFFSPEPWINPGGS